MPNIIDLLPIEIRLYIFTILQSVWPAGPWSFAYQKVNLGWINATHVCKSWRALWLSESSRFLWANYATTFYNETIIQTFLLRASNAPLTIDLDQLHARSVGRLENPVVLQAVVSPTLWSRTRKLVTHARHAGFRHYTESLTSHLNTTPLSSLCDLDVFLPRSLGRLERLHAPSLRVLALRSNASKPDECPLSLGVLNDILRNSRYLKDLSLHRVVDTTSAAEITIDEGADITRVLDKLDIGSFDERLIQPIIKYCKLSTTASVRIELYDVVEMTEATQSALSILDARNPASMSAQIRFEEDYAYGQSGLNVIYRFHFCAVHIVLTGGGEVIYRMDELRPSWEWHDLTHALPINALSTISLGISPYSDDYLPPPHYLPTAMINHSSGLRTLHIEDKIHLDLLSALPEASQLNLLSVNLPFGAETRDITRLWHWLRSRIQIPEGLTVVLKGKVLTEESVDDYHYFEAPVLDSLTKLCCVRDERTFTDEAKSDHGPLSASD